MMRSASFVPRPTRMARARSKFLGPPEEHGGTLVEFALIVILLMTMLLGIIEVSRALYTYHCISHAARAATRWAAVNGQTCGADNSCDGTGGMNNGTASDVDIQNYVKSIVPPGIIDTSSTGCGGSGCLTTTVSWPIQTNSPPICGTAVNGVGPYPKYPGCTVEVQVSYVFNFLFPMIRSSSVNMSSISEMVIAH